MSTSDLFSNEEKIKAFDMISMKYFERNFGTMTKADFETVLFSIFLEHLIEGGEAYDDYQVSKVLGITQSKVRTLKMKKELQYPHNDKDEWKAQFVNLIQYAVYDKESRMVSLLISDVGIQTELRYYMEINHLYDECPPNVHQFKCRLDFFLKICEKLSDEEIILSEDQFEKLKELKKAGGKEESAIQKIISGNVQEGLKELALIGTKEVIVATLNCLPFSGITQKAFEALANTIEKAS